jgi:hypothetical protein
MKIHKYALEFKGVKHIIIRVINKNECLKEAQIPPVMSEFAIKIDNFSGLSVSKNVNF